MATAMRTEPLCLRWTVLNRLYVRVEQEGTFYAVDVICYGTKPLYVALYVLQQGNLNLLGVWSIWEFGKQDPQRLEALLELMGKVTVRTYLDELVGEIDLVGDKEEQQKEIAELVFKIVRGERDEAQRPA